MRAGVESGSPAIELVRRVVAGAVAVGRRNVRDGEVWATWDFTCRRAAAVSDLWTKSDDRNVAIARPGRRCGLRPRLTSLRPRYSQPNAAIVISRWNMGDVALAACRLRHRLACTVCSYITPRSAALPRYCSHTTTTRKQLKQNGTRHRARRVHRRAPQAGWREAGEWLLP